MKQNCRPVWAAVCAAFIVLALFPACNGASSSAVKSVGPGDTWQVAETTRLTGLTIAEGASVTAPEGRSLTLTVDGVETPPAPGAYEGDIVLTPAADILYNFSGMGAQETYRYRAAIYVDEDGYSAEKSVASAVMDGEVTDASATDVKITSVGDKFNGIIVRGDARYSINDPVINMTGNGGNDFAGFGASIMVDEKAEVTIENARIRNTGVVRPAIWIGGDGTATINNADIETHSGTLPSDYSFSWVEGGLGKGEFFMEVPWMLGCVGNTRSTVLMANGRAYYNNSHIKAYGWGALSTDQVSSDAVLQATDCLIETVESGYGAFADGSANTYSGCTFNVADYGLIMQRGSAHFTDGTVVNSDRLGVMSYSGSTILTIDKGCVFNTKKAAIQVKGGSPDIMVDNAQLNSESGVIFQAMLLDDPVMIESSGSGGIPGVPEGDAQGAAAGGGPKVTFKNVTLNGDIITSMTTEGDVEVTLEKTTITGAITTSIAEHARGPNGEEIAISDKTDLYYLIGEVIDTYGATDDAYGMKVSLDGNSRWTIDETSYLTGLTVSKGATVTAPEGYRVVMTVDGVETAIGAGSYTGKIELRVSPGS